MKQKSDILGIPIFCIIRKIPDTCRSSWFSYPAYITSVGWLGYSDEKVLQLTKEAVAKGFNHFKMKVGTSFESDLRRGKLIRSVIDDPQYHPKDKGPLDPSGPELEGKNAGPTGGVLMIDANQVWDVNQAIEYTKGLAEIRPWCAREERRLPHGRSDPHPLGSSRSPRPRTISSVMPPSERPSSHMVSVSRPGSMHITGWSSSSSSKRKPSTSAKSTLSVSLA